ncbi:MAG: hypothetical protein HGA80_09440, partial [Candidatus Omnitrophica bacterium]|nr:hypothetical protein [Candidatus Omnitrophota bacterium]
VFNYIKEEPGNSGEMIPRKYFSGGIMPNVGTVMAVEDRRAPGDRIVIKDAAMVSYMARPLEQRTRKARLDMGGQVSLEVLGYGETGDRLEIAQGDVRRVILLKALPSGDWDALLTDLRKVYEEKTAVAGEKGTSEQVASVELAALVGMLIRILSDKTGDVDLYLQAPIPSRQERAERLKAVLQPFSTSLAEVREVLREVGLALKSGLTYSSGKLPGPGIVLFPAKAQYTDRKGDIIRGLFETAGAKVLTGKESDGGVLFFDPFFMTNGQEPKQANVHYLQEVVGNLKSLASDYAQLTTEQLQQAEDEILQQIRKGVAEYTRPSEDGVSQVVPLRNWPADMRRWYEMLFVHLLRLEGLDDKGHFLYLLKDVASNPELVWQLYQTDGIDRTVPEAARSIGFLGADGKTVDPFISALLNDILQVPSGVSGEAGIKSVFRSDITLFKVQASDENAIRTTAQELLTAAYRRDAVFWTEQNISGAELSEAVRRKQAMSEQAFMTEVFKQVRRFPNQEIQLMLSPPRWDGEMQNFSDGQVVVMLLAKSSDVSGNGQSSVSSSKSVDKAQKLDDRVSGDHYDDINRNLELIESNLVDIDSSYAFQPDEVARTIHDSVAQMIRNQVPTNLILVFIDRVVKSVSRVADKLMSEDKLWKAYDAWYVLEKFSDKKIVQITGDRYKSEDPEPKKSFFDVTYDQVLNNIRLELVPQPLLWGQWLTPEWSPDDAIDILRSVWHTAKVDKSDTGLLDFCAYIRTYVVDRAKIDKKYTEADLISKILSTAIEDYPR